MIRARLWLCALLRSIADWLEPQRHELLLQDVAAVMRAGEQWIPVAEAALRLGRCIPTRYGGWTGASMLGHALRVHEVPLRKRGGVMVIERLDLPAVSR